MTLTTIPFHLLRKRMLGGNKRNLFQKNDTETPIDRREAEQSTEARIKQVNQVTGKHINDILRKDSFFN